METAKFEATTVDEPGWLRIRREPAPYPKADVANRALIQNRSLRKLAPRPSRSMVSLVGLAPPPIKPNEIERLSLRHDLPDRPAIRKG